MNDLRDKIADALAQYAVQSNPYSLSIGIDMTHEAADAVLAVIDLDKVRAEAQVEALEDLATAHYLDGPQSTYGTIMRYADRIAREAGIETGESNG